MNLLSLTPVGMLNEKARTLIDNKFPGLLEKVDYNISSHLKSALEINNIDDEADGAYDHETRTIYLHRDSQLTSAIHEIGHAVHYQLLNTVDYALPEEGKSERAYVNHKEDFAEAFMDCVLSDKENVRNFTIMNILKGGCNAR
jgi:hypothetical protein